MSAHGGAGHGGAAAAGARPRVGDAWIVVTLFLAAVAVRLGVIGSSGGLHTLNGYDDGVYFSATTSLLHGLVPYRDFVLLHPPGILVLAAGPMAALYGAGLSDSDTLAAMRLVFVGLGGLNTVLVFFAGRHLSRAAGVVAASLYAVWGPVIREERTMLLETIVILGTLVALALVPPLSNRDVSGRWRPVLAGVVGGLAIATKLWAVVPLGLIILGLLVVRRWRRALVLAVTTAATAVAVLAPFLVLAPSQLWNMVVAAQVGRPGRAGGSWPRVAEMINLPSWPFSALVDPTVPTAPVNPNVVEGIVLASARGPWVTAAVVAVGLVVSVLVAVRLPVTRMWVALLAVQSVVLLSTPVFFSGYASFVAPALVLVAGALGHLVWNASWVRGSEDHPGAARPGNRRALVAGLAACTWAVLAWGAVLTDRGSPIRPPLAPVLAEATCVASDSPAAIVLADRLTPNLDNGCPAVVDFSGVVYTFPWTGDGLIGPTALREQSPQFQQFARDYFGSADHVILRRRARTGLDEESLRQLRERPLIRKAYPQVYGPAGSSAPAAEPAAPDSDEVPSDDGE